ncbi:hypothetical protein [Bacillus cereus]|nr:hypothetical protein [Bacillus cereus]
MNFLQKRGDVMGSDLGEVIIKMLFWLAYRTLGVFMVGLGVGWLIWG